MTSPAPVHEIDVDALAERLASGATLVDVRQPDEYVGGHVPGARLVPMGEVPDRLGEFPPGVLVICRSGARSMNVCQFLAAQGIEATNVAGGTLAWVSSGRDVVVGDEPV